jgi:hypothetical protein
MKHLLSALLALVSAAAAADRREIIVAVGAGGAEEYRDAFAASAELWRKAAATADAGLTLIDAAPDRTDSLALLQKALETAGKEGSAELWLVLLGHGTFDREQAKFNLPGDDLSSLQLAEWLQPFQRPVVVLGGFSASGAFLKPLSAPNRVIVTATRSGAEDNYSRFGGYLSEAIGGTEADLDKDGQTSLLEAWLFASRRVAEFYESEGRLATEHPLLDDNGDGLGTPPDWFEGVRVVKKAKGAELPDGTRARQIHLIPSEAERALPPQIRAERDALELELASLREQKSSIPEDEYYQQLEALLLQLARLQRDGKAAASQR